MAAIGTLAGLLVGGAVAVTLVSLIGRLRIRDERHVALWERDERDLKTEWKGADSVRPAHAKPTAEQQTSKEPTAKEPTPEDFDRAIEQLGDSQLTARWQRIVRNKKLSSRFDRQDHLYSRFIRQLCQVERHRAAAAWRTRMKQEVLRRKAPEGAVRLAAETNGPTQRPPTPNPTERRRGFGAVPMWGWVVLALLIIVALIPNITLLALVLFIGLILLLLSALFVKEPLPPGAIAVTGSALALTLLFSPTNGSSILKDLHLFEWKGNIGVGSEVPTDLITSVQDISTSIHELQGSAVAIETDLSGIKATVDSTGLGTLKGVNAGAANLKSINQTLAHLLGLIRRLDEEEP